MSGTEFIVGLVGFLVTLGIISVIVKKSREYGMRTFLSKQYALLCFGFICSIIAVFFVNPNETGLMVAAGTASCTFLAVLTMNIKQSNMMFGTVFTIFQTLMITCFFLIVVAVLHWGSERAKSL